MRAVVQRVASARVTVDGETVGEIARGLLVYLGVGVEDEATDVAAMADKVARLRLFEDDAGKMSLSVLDVGGAVLVVSQFTLFGDVRGGRRPSFVAAAPPERAKLLYEEVCARLRAAGLPVETGRFRATMSVLSDVDGPVTLLVDTRKTF
jgi:D-tyrosyl-tRNA(Tyr) deacylase